MVMFNGICSGNHSNFCDGFYCFFQQGGQPFCCGARGAVRGLRSSHDMDPFHKIVMISIINPRKLYFDLYFKLCKQVIL